MNILLWVLQGLAALLFGASGVMKVFLFDKVSKDVPSFGALPRGAWMALGILELVCTVGLIVPGALHWQPSLTVVAAAILRCRTIPHSRAPCWSVASQRRHRSPKPRCRSTPRTPVRSGGPWS